MLSFAVVLFFNTVFANAELNCSDLNIGTSVIPFNGETLSYCSNTVLQCCTDEYLRGKVTDTRDRLTASLKNELLSGNFLVLDSIINELENYITDTFLHEFVSNRPLIDKLQSSNRENIINSFVSGISANLKINSSSSFNLSVYFSQHLQGINLNFINDYIGQYVVGGLNSVRRVCLTELLNENFVNHTVIQGIVNDIENLRKIYSFLSETRDWYENNFIPAILSSQFPKVCVSSFIRLQCSACFKNIPPLCKSNCQYLTQGCFVPFRQGLSAQMNILWNVTRQLLNELNTEIIPEAFYGRGNILEIDFNEDTGFNAYAASANSICNIFISKLFGRKKRSTNFMTLPPSIISNTSVLNGLFEYNSNGPLFCQTNPNENCWNGQQEIVQDNTTVEYNDSIENQDMNPVASFNRTELLNIAQALGTPVSDFLVNHSLLVGINIETPVGEIFDVELPPRPIPSSTTTTDALSTTTIVDIMHSSISASMTPTNILNTGPPNSSYYLSSSFALIFFICILQILIIIMN